MTTVRIDLRTLKKNPNAGNTMSHVHGKTEAYIEFTCKDQDIEKKLEDMIYIVGKYVSFPLGNVKIEAHVDHNSIKKIIPKLLKLGVKNENIKFSVNHNVETIYHQPEREYFYSYLDTKVKCEHCSEEFSHKELMDDEVYDSVDDEYYFTTNVCPACGAAHCCDFSYETINQALERKNGTKKIRKK